MCHEMLIEESEYDVTYTISQKQTHSTKKVNYSNNA